MLNSNLTGVIETYEYVKNSSQFDQGFKERCLENEVEFRCYQIINFANIPIELAKIICDLKETLA